MHTLSAIRIEPWSLPANHTAQVFAESTTIARINLVAKPYIDMAVRLGAVYYQLLRIDAPAIGERANKSMSAKAKYFDESVRRTVVVPDFLPAPEDLVFRDEGIKVTLALSKRSVEFFKREATKHNTQYQRMIRRLLDAYAEHHAQALSPRGGAGPSAVVRTRGTRRSG